MARPRSQQISLDTTAYYHCIGRCVRRAFLCGEDALTGRSFEHRRAWMVERLALLTDVFAIDLYAYAVMANHYHLVVRINPARMDAWSDHDIAQRWLRLFTGPRCVHQWLTGGELDAATHDQALAEIAKWRQRLADLSWFMRCLNEHIARRANEEDHCTGHFWEGRFKVHALRDEASVLRCMAYVDLNPVRAGLATVPEEGDYTSYQQRCRGLVAGEFRSGAAVVDRVALKAGATSDADAIQRADTTAVARATDATSSTGATRKLASPHSGIAVAADPEDAPDGLALPRLIELGHRPDVEPCEDPPCPIRQFALSDYLALVDWTGRAEQPGKRHAIPAAAANVMQRLNLDSAEWLALMRPRKAAVLKFEVAGSRPAPHTGPMG
ncbi:transposase [Alcanivorax quisquiliarum]|uniref:Transposase n=1 Tax=Alcanivorax quisquiliarum TaxID=2933565 RepID=A0ABT0EB72_9GAMM|nr:transposase [Alcanivorax quisquiliarum]MCK0538872.1 transposase [Alcanivorax quisquiliarum]